MKDNEKTKERLVHELTELRLQNAMLKKSMAGSISAELAAEEATKLMKSESDLRMMIEKNVDGLIIVDVDGILLFMNPAAESLFGRTAEKLMGKPMGLPLVSGEAEEMDISAKDGTQRTVEMRTASINWEEKEAFLVSLRDITKRKQIEAGLETTRKELVVIKQAAEAREFAESVINTVREPLIALDQDLRVVSVSRSFYEFFKVNPEETVGQLIYDLGNKQWDIPKLRELLETILPQKTTFDNYEVEHVFAGIGKRIMLLNARQIQRELGKELIILLAIEDITELTKIRQKQLEMKDNFLSHVSHELRTPLTVIHQFVSILQDGIPGELNAEQQQYLEITMRNIKSLHGMIDDLLESSRAHAGKLTVERQIISLHKIVEELISQYLNIANDKIVILSSHIQAENPLLHADPERTRQILINLIDNAIKFSPDNCSITIDAHIYEEDPGFLCVSVSDTGSGIPPEKIDKIFEYLYQVESNFEATRKGLGLGLYICKDLVSRHGGRIWAESQIGRGTTFYFTLPIFSYVCLLSPILTWGNLKDGVHLLTIESVTVNKDISENQKKLALTEVWQILNRCFLPDMDVILPRIGRLNCGEIFFLAACTNEKGIKILKKRVRNQIARVNTLHDILATKVSSAMINIPANELGTHVDNLRKSVYECVKDMVHSTLNRKRKYYEKNSYCR